MPSNVLTMFFAGSGHGLTSNYKDDTMIETYHAVTGPAIFLPGPGGKDPQIYRKNCPHSKDSIMGENSKGHGYGNSATKRSITGKGWNRNIWYALEGIEDFLKNQQGAVTINITGHSRGSITVIMLMNDILHEFVPHTDDYKIASTFKGTKTFSKRSNAKTTDFSKWYELRLKKLWASRMGSDVLANQGVQFMKHVMSQKHRISFNIWLFDPVGGLNQGDSSRKQQMPDHPSIKRVRILRMEAGGAGGTLSSNMPRFKKYKFLTGAHSKDLMQFQDEERYLIPMPGGHGWGLSSNKGASDLTMYIGTSYMVSLLKACGTEFQKGFMQRYCNIKTIMENYAQLYKDFLDVAPGWDDKGGGKTLRRTIHWHHGKGNYLGNAVNCHHRYLNDH